jgi:hypothetical protein
MRKLLLWAALIPLALLLACGEASQEEGVTSSDSALMARSQSADSTEDRAAFPTPGPEFSSAAETAAAGPVLEPSMTAAAQIGGQRQIVSNASVSVEVDEVESAVNDVRSIAEGYGGFVERLSISGGASARRAALTVRVPQEQFLDAVENIAELGEVQEMSLGRDDVAGQFIDLEARLKSAQSEEASLLALLAQAPDIEHVLTIERELSRVRSEIERLQGQLNHLQQLTNLATIQVSLFSPEERLRLPPSAHLSIEAERVSGLVNQIRKMIEPSVGELERVVITTHEEGESADVWLLVDPQEFSKLMAFLEGSGKVVYKEVEEGIGPPVEPVSSVTGAPGPSRSRIYVTLRQPQPFDTANVVIFVLVGLGILAVLAVGLFLTYQWGRGRRDRRDRYAQI